MQIVGYHIYNQDIVNSNGDISHDPLNFLLSDSPDSIKVFYNLDWAVARLCWLMNITIHQLQLFWKTGKLYHEGYKLFFVPHRYLGISYGDHETSFSDIFQYDVDLPFDVEPLAAAKKAKEIGEVVYGTLCKIGLEPTSISSPVSSFQKQVLDLMDLPTNDDLPPEVMEYAYRCLHGGWQEAFQKGHWNQTWDYDLISAYPHSTANLIDHRKGKWVKSSKFYPDLPFGFCKGKVRIDKNVSPVIYDTGKIQLTPRGEWKTPPVFLTTRMIKRLYDYKIGQYKIEDAWYWEPYKLETPLKDIMETLFEWKQYLSGMERDIIKRILNGIWGKTQEVFYDGSPGRLINFAWAATIEDSTRAKMVDFIYSNHAEDNVLSLSVDGCQFDKKIEIPNSQSMGDWRLEHDGVPAFVVSSGVSALKGKQGKGTFSFTYDWLKSEIGKDGSKNSYAMTKQTPVTIGNALKNNKVNKLGEIETSERAVIVDYEIKRLFNEYPHTGRDLLHKKYKSVSVDITMAMSSPVL